MDKHPNMKAVVVKEVEQLLYRPNIPVKAQYVVTIDNRNDKNTVSSQKFYPCKTYLVNIDHLTWWAHNTCKFCWKNFKMYEFFDIALIFCFLALFRYYCICFVNRLLLSHEERDLAVKLIRLYFSFFKVTKYKLIYDLIM